MASARALGEPRGAGGRSLGRLLRTRDLLQYATGTAQLYDPNPVVANGGTDGLSDADDADSALLTAFERRGRCARLDASTCLRGSYVEAVLPAGDPDADTPAGDVCSPTLDFTAVTRSNNRFEALMAYFHIDRAQTYLQALGFPNVLNRPVRANVDAQIPGPLTEDGQDNSFFDLLTGRAHLRDRLGRRRRGRRDDPPRVRARHPGGPGARLPGRSDAGAIGEGFGDYFASAMSAVFAPRAGFEGCFDEWDAFASGLGDCLRRVDLGLRLGDPSPDCEPADDEHCRGEVWSGALWSIRGALGGAVADKLVIQSQFSLTPTASFDQAARALLAADSALYRGVHRTQLKTVLGARGLVDVERLDNTPADATSLGLPARVGGRVGVGADEHDVYALKLTARRPVVFQLQISGRRTTTFACWPPAPPVWMRRPPRRGGPDRLEGDPPRARHERHLLPRRPGRLRQRVLPAPDGVRRLRRRRRGRRRGRVPERVRPAPARLGRRPGAAIAATAARA